MPEPKVFVIIVAAGTGSRFGGDVPKQFLPFGPEGKPVLMHTVGAFTKTGCSVTDIVVVLSKEMVDYWQELCRQHNFKSPKVVCGGEERFHSVKNALNTLRLEDGDIVLVHDGVRPFVTERLIKDVVRAASIRNAAVPAVPLKDSIRKFDTAAGASQAVPRSDYVCVQTPQGFKGTILAQAYGKQFQRHFTDDAAVVEADGVDIAIVDGDYDNIKITSPVDFLIAESLLVSKKTD